MLFIDSNVPMYVVGNDQERKLDTYRQVERALASGERLVTDAEVFQEILHRYTAIDRREAIEPAFTALAAWVDEVYPITIDDVRLAKEIVAGSSALSARDAVHVAVMRRHAVDRILSFDRGFDRVNGLTRLGEIVPVGQGQAKVR